MEAPVRWYTPNKTWQEHFWLNTQCPTHHQTECWIWQGAVRKKDGCTLMEIIGDDGIRLLRTAQTASWLINKKTPIEGSIRQSCQNKMCVSPHHLILQNKQSRAKLTEQKVKEIRQRAVEGESFASLARTYEVGRSQIGRICKGQRWTHI